MDRSQHIRAHVVRPALVLGLAAAAAGCKKPENKCDPRQVEWGVQLAIQASQNINPDDTGTALPTVLRFYQVRGEIATEDLDFEKVWQAEEAKDLGESFLSMEEMTMRPDAGDLRMLPLESEATHVMAAALFREPVGTTWFGTYEIPRRHPEVVCSKAPKNQEYPNPCFFVFIDRNQVAAGESPPPGYELDATTQCAPLGVVPEPQDDSRKARRERRRKVEDNIEDPLRANDVKTPQTPQTPRTPQPKTPQTPRTPQTPKAPKTPRAPTAPRTPDVNPL